MMGVTGCGRLSDAAWAVREPLIEAVRPRGKTPPKELRRTIPAVFWRNGNGARWRAVPAELGPWWLAAQLFMRRGKQGVWERLPALAEARMGGRMGGPALGMVFLDGTSIRAHHKAAGAQEGGWTASGETAVTHLAASRLRRTGVVVAAPRCASPPTAAAER